MFEAGQAIEAGDTAVAVGLFAGWPLALYHEGLVTEERANKSNAKDEKDLNDKKDEKSRRRRIRTSRSRTRWQ